MEKQKHWYQSRGVWGAAAAVVLTVVRLLGYSAPADAAANLTDLLLQLATVVAGGVALFGRLQADSRITGRKPD